MTGAKRWFERREAFAPTTREPAADPGTPEFYTRCPGCSELLYDASLAEALKVCAKCGHHFPLEPEARLLSLCDVGSLSEHDGGLVARDALGFFDSKPYKARLTASQKSVGRNDAFLSASGAIHGVELEIGCFDFRFMGGSMGSVVGESITRLYERAIDRKVPAVVVSASGGARMQEGVLSLMQMARTCAALARLRDEAKMPYVSILTHPTTGGVAASFAMLGDVIVAEPRSLIGFAGPRVIKETIGQALPDGFQTSEYLLEHGMIDAIVERAALRPTVGTLLRQLMGLDAWSGERTTAPPAASRERAPGDKAAS